MSGVAEPHSLDPVQWSPRLFVACGVQSWPHPSAGVAAAVVLHHSVGTVQMASPCTVLPLHCALTV